MKVLSMDKAMLRRRILRFNILIGLLVFVAAVALNISGEYNCLDELKAANAMFSFTAVGGLLYAAVFWVYCVMSKPFWFPFAGRLEAGNKD
jgi:hypothetical protein